MAFLTEEKCAIGLEAIRLRFQERLSWVDIAKRLDQSGTAAITGLLFRHFPTEYATLLKLKIIARHDDNAERTSREWDELVAQVAAAPPTPPVIDLLSGLSDDAERDHTGALRPGNPVTWGAITDGTSLDGAPYEKPE